MSRTGASSELTLAIGEACRYILNSALFGSGGLRLPMNAAMADMPKLLNAPVRSSGGQYATTAWTRACWRLTASPSSGSPAPERTPSIDTMYPPDDAPTAPMRSDEIPNRAAW